MELPLSLSSFDEIKKTVFEVAGNTPKTRQALLACDELLTNIVSYSGANDLTFSCQKEDEELRILFSDDGIPFDSTSVRTGSREFEEMDQGGMGLNIIRQSVSAGIPDMRCATITARTCLPSTVYTEDSVKYLKTLTNISVSI